MIIKGKWKKVCLGLCVKVSFIIGCIPMLTFIVCSIKNYNSLDANFDLTTYTAEESMGIAILLMIIHIIVINVVYSSDTDEKIDWYFNVKRRTVEEQREIRLVPVIARFAGYTGLTNSRESFSVKVQLDENLYYNFSSIEEYAATKEGEMVEVEVKLYIDADGDVFYIEPLGIVKSNETIIAKPNSQTQHQTS